MRIIGLVAIVFILSGCADTVEFSNVTSMELVGFWYGLWHGSIVWFAWVGSLFSDDIALYAVYNNGGWYDYGYVMGIGGATTSAVIQAKKVRNV